METLATAIETINENYWYFVIALLCLAGVWFTIRTGAMQIRWLPEMFRTITEKPSDISEGKKGISAFRAFTISAAARVGSANVAGVAIAITVGGPGSVFWMWVLAILGGATSFIESALAQLYKVRRRDSYVGGPAYYMRDGLGWKKVAVCFAVIVTVTYGFIFPTVQANSIAASIDTQFSFEGSWPMFAIGVVLALLTAAVVFGGVRRLSSVTEIMVPIMAVGYVAVALFVVAINIGEVPGMIGLIVGHALGFKEVAGAALGAAFMQGVRRGLFSNEAGMGSIPNAAATASVSHPAKQGLVQSLGVYLDTLVVCSATAFIILLSNPEYGGEAEGIALTQNALADQVGDWAIPFLIVTIFFLAFSSILGSAYIGEVNVRFIRESDTWVNVFRAIVCVMVVIGTVSSLELVWNLADLFMGVMATINLIALIPLAKIGLRLMSNYGEQRKQGLEPIFSRDDIPEAKGVSAWDGTDPITVRTPETDVNA